MYLYIIKLLCATYFRIMISNDRIIDTLFCNDFIIEKV